MRSLWVQGYTEFFRTLQMSIYAFPVGTGIYRAEARARQMHERVPCGYRDIPINVPVIVDIFKRSLWVQGYTVTNDNTLPMHKAFPVGTGIYRKY